MGKQEFFNKLIFYFENTTQKTHKQTDENLVNKVRNFLNEQKPRKIWEEKGVMNKKLQTNIYLDFTMILNEKLIACKVERSNLSAKFDLLEGLKFFDEIWFFTDIPLEKKHLHYKFENELKIPQRFFGLNRKGEIAEIKIH